MLEKEKKHLSFRSLVECAANLYLKLPDWRQPAKVQHTIRDTAMSGVAMMYFQSDSVLDFQRQLEEGSSTEQLVDNVRRGRGSLRYSDEGDFGRGPQRDSSPSI